MGLYAVFIRRPLYCRAFQRIHRKRESQHNLSKTGWSWGCVATVDSNGRTIFVADAHRDDGKRFVMRADEKLTAFVELKSEICACGELA
jgi:hypothetical protein